MTGTTSPAKIEVCDLVKDYGGKRAVDGVNLQVQAGTVFGLLGPNGAGKTTVLECLLGLKTPDGGFLKIDGVDVRSPASRSRQQVGTVLQRTDLQDRITPREAIELFGAFYPAALPTTQLLDRFRLEDKADAPYATLSGGQRQRLSLALAFVHEPEILCLDEPTVGLDPASRRDLHALIRQWRDEGRTVLLTTHHTEEAHALCDRIAVLREGRIVAVDQPGNLINRSRRRPRIVLRADDALDAAGLRAEPGFFSVEVAGNEATLEVEDVGSAVVTLVHWLGRRRIELVDLRIVRPSLEDTVIALADGSQPGPL